MNPQQPTPRPSIAPLVIVGAVLIVLVGYKLWQGNGQFILDAAAALPPWAPAAGAALVLMLACGALAGLARLRRLPSARPFLARLERQAGRATHSDKVKISLGVRRRPLGIYTQVRIRVQDTLSHMLILGVPESGKSRLVQYLTAQYILLGHAVAVIDPHAGLVHGILSLIAPQFQAREGIWLGAEEFGRVPVLALLHRAGVPAEDSAQMVADVVATLTEDAQSNNIAWWTHFATWAISHAGYTLLETPRFLNDAAYYDYVRRRCEDEPRLADLFRAAARKTRAQFALESRAAEQRLQQLVHAAGLQSLLAEPITDANYIRYRQEQLPDYAVTPINVGDALNKARPILCQFDRQAMHGEQKMACALALGLFAAAVTARQVVGDMAVEPLTHLVGDEIATYATSRVTEMIDEGRKFRVNMIAVGQGLALLTSELREALTHVKVFVAYSVSPNDAESLANSLFEHNAVMTDGDDDATARHPSASRLIQADEVNKLAIRTCYVRVAKVWRSARLLTMPDIRAIHDDAACRRARHASAQRDGSDAALVRAELALRARFLDGQLYDGAPHPAAPDASARDMDASIDTDTDAPRNRFD